MNGKMDGELTVSLRTRRVRRMNCSLSCFRRLLGMLSLGMTNRSRGGTWSPTSCISPSTIHHSDFSSAFLMASAGDLDRRLGDRASVRIRRNWLPAASKHQGKVLSLFARESILETHSVTESPH